MKTLLTLGALASLAAASAASAQTPTATAPAGGPPIPGVCTFAQREALATSTAGKAVNTRMGELKAQVTAELTPEAQSIRSEEEAFKALPREQQQAKAPALQAKVEQFQRKAQLLNAELEATLQKQAGLIDQSMNPIVQSVYTERKCSLLLERGEVYLANPEMDITSAVVQRLDAKLPSVPPFSRENLSQQGAAAAPAPLTTTTHHRKK